MKDIAAPLAVTRAPGFYDDTYGLRRWWDGRAWAHRLDAASVVSEDVQQQALNRVVGDWVSRGWTLEFTDGRRATMSRRVPMSFLGNAVGVILTGGLWLIYILVRIGSPRFDRQTFAVHPNGAVQ